MTMATIFVSYSSKDISHVNSVSSIGSDNLLKNINLWIATQKKDKISQLKPGEKWRDEIEKNINNSSGAILLVSKNFLDAEIITNFELPLIIKKKEEDSSYKIYPLLLDECDYQDNAYLSSLQFSNSPNTFLKSLSGKRYQLEIENLVNHINEDFQNKKSKFQILNKLISTKAFTLGLTISLIIGGLFLFYNQNASEETTSIDTFETLPQEDLINESKDFYPLKNLGVGDCFNVLINDENAWIDVENQDDSNAKSNIVSNPFFKILNQSSCSDQHYGQITAKFQVQKNSFANLVFPGSYLGVYMNYDVCWTDLSTGTCIGAVIEDVIPNSPASNIGLKKNDVITSINGFDVSTVQELTQVLFLIDSEVDRKNVVLGIIPDGSIEQTRVIDLLPKRGIPDSRKEILLESQAFCDSEGSVYNPYEFEELVNLLDQNSKESNEEVYFSLPILDENTLSDNSFTIYCGLFLLTNEAEAGVSSNLETYSTWKGDVIQLHNEKYGYSTIKDMYLNRNDKFTIKTFDTLEVGDCMNLQEDISSPRAEEHIFVTVNDCRNVTEQIIGSYEINPSERNLIINSDEFFYNLQEICQESVIALHNNPAVAFGAYYLSYNEENNLGIRSPMLLLPYWAENSGNVSVKCAFVSANKSGSFLRFDDLFAPSIQEKSNTNILETTFSYCPANIFYGEGFYIGNNFTPFFDSRDNKVVVVAEWSKGQYPITRLVFTTNNGTLVIPGVEGLDLVNFSEYYKSLIYSSYVNLDMENYPNLQKLNNGAMPLIIVMPIDGEEPFEGQEKIQIRAYDTSGAESWTTCTLNIIKNPKGVDDVVLDFGKQAELEGNSFGGKDLYSEKFNFNELIDTNIPKLRKLDIYEKNNKIYIDFDIEIVIPELSTESLPPLPNRIFINLGICTIPDATTSGCVDQITKKGSIYSQHRFTQRVHFLENYDYELQQENEDTFIASYKNIVMNYVPCQAISYDYSEQYLSNPLYKIYDECLDKEYDQIALLLESIDFGFDYFSDTGCNFTFNAFSEKNSDSRPFGQSIIIGKLADLCDSGYWKIENVPITSGRSFGEKQYIKNYDFSKVTDLELYEGTPYLIITP